MGVNLKGVSLDGEEKRILSYLGGGYDESIGLNDIVKYLKDVGYEDVTRRKVLDKLDRLSDVGYVRSKTKGKGENREEKFYLSSYVGGGMRARRGTQGRGLVNDVEKTFWRIFNPGKLGVFFIFAGIAAMIYSGMNVTGAVISDGASVELTFIFSFVLMVIGGILVKKKK